MTNLHKRLRETRPEQRPAQPAHQPAQLTSQRGGRFATVHRGELAGDTALIGRSAIERVVRVAARNHLAVDETVILLTSPLRHY